jgi:signal transduction histidine kinase
LTPSRFSVWLGSAVALAIGLPLLLWGVFTTSAAKLAWFVPVCDGIAFACMVVVALLVSLDVTLRESRRSLPLLFIAAATAIMWLGHFVIFPGDIPGVTGQRFNQATSTLFLTINLTTPLMLTVALVQRAGPLSRPKAAIALAIAGGVGLGLLAIGLSIALGPAFETVSPTGQFLAIDALVGVAGLIPAVFGLSAYFLGMHGDERVAGGVLAALTFTALNSIDLLFLHARYTPSWYADHALALLPFAALVAGQLWLYAGSVLAERHARAVVASAAERRRIGLDVAEAMATETDPLPVVDRLLTGVLEALDADRVTMVRLVSEGFVVERSVDRERLPAHVGTVLPLESVVAGGRHVVSEAVNAKAPVVLGSYRVDGLDAETEISHVGIRQSVIMPLVRGGEVDSVLIVGRRADRRFTQADVDQLEELGALAALLIRNARLLADAEETSRAKSNFINLAAHELGTPISVIRGYIEMLADETLGPIGARQREPVAAVRSTVNDLASRVDQLLAASRLEAGTSETSFDLHLSAELTGVVRDAIQRSRDRATLIGADISFDVPGVEIPVEGSEHDLGIIIDNLLNNAMTYSRTPAQIRVQVEDGEAPEVKVVDSGIGIPVGARERIFDQFYRVDDAEFGYPSGTGLGLYISRRLAERWGARLFLERSNPGQGSVFTLRLQRQKT